MKEKIKITVESRRPAPSPFANGMHTQYRLTAQYNGVTYTFTYHDSVANFGGKLNKMDALYSILMDAQAYDSVRNEKEFLDEFGYDEFNLYSAYSMGASIRFLENCYAKSDVEMFEKGLKAYRGCKKASEKLHDMLTDEEFEKLQEEFQDY